LAKLNKIYTRKQIDAIREELILKHGDQCAICKRPRSAFKNRLSVDHAHKTGRIRGLLCFFCNKRIIGRHTLETAKQIMDYLLKYDLPAEKK